MLPFFFFFFISPALSQTPIFVPVTKDPFSLLYTITISLQSPPQSTKLHLGLGSSFTWLDCSKNYNSSTSQPVPCPSPLCNSFHSFSCSNSTCSVYPENPISREATLASALLDSLSLPIPSSPPQFHLIRDFLFSCSTKFLLTRLANQVSGLAAFGRSNHSLPAQVRFK